MPGIDPLPIELQGDSRSLIARSPSGVGWRPDGGGSPRGPNGDGSPKGNPEAAAAAASDPGASPGYKSAMFMGSPVNSLILGWKG